MTSAAHALSPSHRPPCIVAIAAGPPVSSMTSVNALGEPGQGSIDRWQRELAKPLSGGWCLASWFVATAIFVGAVVLLGDPTWSDAVESLYPTWAIAHGSLACSYPPGSAANFSQVYQPVPSVPPLWPLISGGLSALTGIGHAVPFPTQHAFGASCTNGYTKMYRWALESNVLSATLRLGYSSWVVLLAGFIALLRAVGRGRTRWEAFGAVFLAPVPIVWMPILFEFHPQDLVAVGLGLAGTACALRGQWLWAGIVLGLALVSQQFTLLILVPVVVVAPGRNRWRVLAAAALSVALVSLPFLVATSGRAIHSVLAGTGDSGTRGGTVLWKLLSHPTPLGGMQTAPLIFISRVAPIVVAVALPLWALRRLGPRATRADPSALVDRDLPEHAARFRTRPLRVQVFGSRRPARQSRHRPRKSSRGTPGMDFPRDHGLRTNSFRPDHYPVVAISRRDCDCLHSTRCRPVHNHLGCGPSQGSLVSSRLVGHCRRSVCPLAPLAAKRATRSASLVVLAGGPGRLGRDLGCQSARLFDDAESRPRRPADVAV